MTQSQRNWDNRIYIGKIYLSCDKLYCQKSINAENEFPNRTTKINKINNKDKIKNIKLKHTFLTSIMNKEPSD